MSNMDIVRDTSMILSEHVLKVQASDTGSRSWRWEDTVVVFPEVRCPYCKEGVTSTAVWIIRKDARLVGQAIPVEGEKFKLERPDHPHASTEAYGLGTICFGSATNAIHALFGSLNAKARYAVKSGGYGGVPDWLAGKYWNHTCKKYVPKVHCYRCDTLTIPKKYVYERREYCSKCFKREAFVCAGCDQVYSLYDRYITDDGLGKCETCWRAERDEAEDE